MKQDKISQEEMEMIEHHVNAVDDEIEGALQRYEQERKFKEERNCARMMSTLKIDWQTGLMFF